MKVEQTLDAEVKFTISWVILLRFKWNWTWLCECLAENRQITQIYLTMEGSVSNLEICNLAFTGQFDKLKQNILSDKTLACKTDQVTREGSNVLLVFVYLFTAHLCLLHTCLISVCNLRTTGQRCTGPVLPATQTLWIFCSTWELKWICKMM